MGKDDLTLDLNKTEVQNALTVLKGLALNIKVTGNPLSSKPPQLSAAPRTNVRLDARVNTASMLRQQHPSYGLRILDLTEEQATEALSAIKVLSPLLYCKKSGTGQNKCELQALSGVVGDIQALVEILANNGVNFPGSADFIQTQK